MTNEHPDGPRGIEVVGDNQIPTTTREAISRHLIPSLDSMKRTRDDRRLAITLAAELNARSHGARLMADTIADAELILEWLNNEGTSS